MSTSTWTLETRQDVLVLRMDVPGEKVNVLRQDNMDELAELLDRAAQVAGAKGLLVVSEKDTGFIAGADIRAIAKVQDPEEGFRAARRGQEVFAKLEALPFPTCALLHGACLGGGLELALACRHRIASDDDATRLGLPEVLLGILPGFGGTQRLPRRLGLLAALPLLLTGKQLSARQARRAGLVDDVVPRERMMDHAVARMGRSTARVLSRKARAIEAVIARVGWLRRWILQRARSQVEARSGPLFPAPYRILDAVEAGYRPGGAEGFLVEARLLGELLHTPVSRNLVRLFLLSEKGKDAARTLQRVRSAFLAGAGTMGSGIAALLVGRSIRTRLYDPSAPALEAGVAAIRDALRQKARGARDPAHALSRGLDLLEPTLQWNGLGQRDLFLEVAPENLELKRKILRDAEAGLPERALLATNTSSLDLDQLAEPLAQPGRLVGIHFFNPVHRMRLVEVVRGTRTAAEAVERAVSLVRELGKVPVVVQSGPGFLVNRLLTPYLLEAEKLCEEGVGVEDLDRRARAAGMPMGPFELLDEVGLDIAASVAQVLCSAYPDRFAAGHLVTALVAAGSLGRKSGCGFYCYGRRRSVNTALPARAGGRVPPEEEQMDRLFLPVVLEGSRCLEENVVGSADDIDLAMMLGAGFLLPHGGPMQYARERGWTRVVAALGELEARYGSRFRVPPSLRQLQLEQEAVS